jgi:prevent-host-death family protein
LRREISMLTMSALKARQSFGPLLKAAEREPVAITRHGRRRFVVMSAALYDILREAFEANRERLALVAHDDALAKLMGGEEEKGLRVLAVASARLRRLMDGL